MYENFDMPIYLFKEGTNYESYKFLGSHKTKTDDIEGFTFTVWAPNAKKIELVSDFNSWNGSNHRLTNISDSGIWTIFIPYFPDFTLYKYKIYTNNDEVLYKSDPFGYFFEKSPKTASITYPNTDFKWSDKRWRNKLKKTDIYNSPINIYELHLNSWKNGEIQDKYVNIRDLYTEMVDYIKEMGYTHIELMPVMEHPFDGSWGYQITGYYGFTSRYGTPEDFKFFINYCHKKHIGVILDWVPCHFCKDAHGLMNFDGTPLYESTDHLESENALWGTRNFDFSKPEVISFLISNAVYWIKEFHIDGLRVDAVAYMIYEDINNTEGNTNEFALDFLKKLNKIVFSINKNILMIAEESSAYPLVTAPVHEGGLGFNFKWNMGWMNDVLEYMEKISDERKWFQNLITFSFTYAFSENFILPLSHDEVVHGKKSLLDKMPGPYMDKFSNLRLLYSYMISHPGKKLIFMGGEFGQFIEWNYKRELDWFLLDYESHKALHKFVKELNNLYLKEKSFFELDSKNETFRWINGSDHENSLLTFTRNSKKSSEIIVVILNFSSTYLIDYSIGVPENGKYKLIFNSDDFSFGGNGYSIKKSVISANILIDGFKNSITLNIPPFSGLYYKHKKTKEVIKNE